MKNIKKSSDLEEVLEVLKQKQKELEKTKRKSKRNHSDSDSGDSSKDMDIRGSQQDLKWEKYKKSHNFS